MAIISRILQNPALSDIWQGALHFRLYALLAWTDVKNRYRRTHLGPFWLTISMGVFITAVGVLYSGIFGNRGGEYIPYFGTGIIIWTFLNSTISEQSDAFISASPIIQNIDVPRSIFIFRVLVRTLIVLGHNIIIIFMMLLIFKITINITIISALIGITFISLNGVFVGMCLGLACVRYRDLPHMIASIMQIMFFLTPILWKTSIIGESPGRMLLVKLNPFYHFTEIIRVPIISAELASVSSWMTVVIFTFIFGALAMYLYHKRLRRLGLWL